MLNSPAYYAGQVTLDNHCLYVNQLPGQGGKDWGYVFRASEAKRLTKAQAERFRKHCEYCHARFFIGQW